MRKRTDLRSDRIMTRAQVSQLFDLPREFLDHDRLSGPKTADVRSAGRFYLVADVNAWIDAYQAAIPKVRGGRYGRS